MSIGICRNFYSKKIKKRKAKVFTKTEQIWPLALFGFHKWFRPSVINGVARALDSNKSTLSWSEEKLTMMELCRGLTNEMQNIGFQGGAAAVEWWIFGGTWKVW